LINCFDRVAFYLLSALGFRYVGDSNFFWPEFLLATLVINAYIEACLGKNEFFRHSSGFESTWRIAIAPMG
jgi:hypothetical protein